MVLSRAIVRDMVPQDRAASMIGYVTMGMAVVPMIGPAFGGVLDEIFGWQANFWALFILGAMLFALCWRDLGETAPLTGRTLMQQFRDYPALLTSRRFWGYSLAAGLSSGSFFAYLGGAPFVGDQVFGLSPSLLGVLFGAPAIGYFLGNFASGRFSTRFGVNRMVLWGALFNAGGIGINVALFHLGLGSPLVFFGLMTFMGLGNGMVIPNATAGALSIRPDLAGTASGLSGAMMIGFGAALSALAGTMLTPGSGALVLLWIMFATAVAAVITILLVIRRERRLALV
jgi:DHA1 family bicyclomycin/chloramphenicol resistance-like MFS transporter